MVLWGCFGFHFPRGVNILVVCRAMAVPSGGREGGLFLVVGGPRWGGPRQRRIIASGKASVQPIHSPTGSPGISIWGTTQQSRGNLRH